MARRLVTLLLSLVLAIGLVEVGLRLAAAVVPHVFLRDGQRVATDEEFRIFAIGDSNTYGGGVARSEAYPAHLQRILDASGGPGRFHVTNLGVPGSNSSQVLKRLPRYIQQHKPHLLVVLIGVNDYWNPEDVEDHQDVSGFGSLHRWLLSHSRTYRLGVLVVDYFRWGAAGGQTDATASLETISRRRGAGGDGDATVRELHVGDTTFHFRNTKRPASLSKDEHRELVRSNLERIVEIAEQAQIPIVLPTYAANLGNYNTVNEVVLSSPDGIVVSQVLGRDYELPPGKYRRGELFFPDLHPKGPVYGAFALHLCEQLVEEGLVPLDRCVTPPEAAADTAAAG